MPLSATFAAAYAVSEIPLLSVGRRDVIRMDLLVLGGTAWLGREITAVAVARGHAVTCLARGQSGHVRRAVKALQPMARQFLFVSSGNAYANQRDLGQDEDVALLPPLSSDVMESMELSGEAKSACEEAVLNGFGLDRTLIARTGLIGGRGDEFGQSGYWP